MLLALSLAEHAQDRLAQLEGFDLLSPGNAREREGAPPIAQDPEATTRVPEGGHKLNLSQLVSTLKRSAAATRTCCRSSRIARHHAQQRAETATSGKAPICSVETQQLASAHEARRLGVLCAPHHAPSEPLIMSRLEIAD